MLPVEKLCCLDGFLAAATLYCRADVKRMPETEVQNKLKFRTPTDKRNTGVARIPELPQISGAY